jgi:hypothetical protein
MKDTCRECGEPIALVSTAQGGRWVHVDTRQPLPRQLTTYWVNCRGPVATPTPVEVPSALTATGANCAFCGGAGQVRWRDFTDPTMTTLLRCARCDGFGVDEHPPTRKFTQEAPTP